MVTNKRGISSWVQKRSDGRNLVRGARVTLKRELATEEGRSESSQRERVAGRKIRGMTGSYARTKELERGVNPGRGLQARDHLGMGKLQFEEARARD